MLLTAYRRTDCAVIAGRKLISERTTVRKDQKFSLYIGLRRLNLGRMVFDKYISVSNVLILPYLLHSFNSPNIIHVVTTPRPPAREFYAWVHETHLAQDQDESVVHDENMTPSDRKSAATHSPHDYYIYHTRLRLTGERAARNTCIV